MFKIKIKNLDAFEKSLKSALDDPIKNLPPRKILRILEKQYHRMGIGIYTGHLWRSQTVRVRYRVLQYGDTAHYATSVDDRKPWLSHESTTQEILNVIEEHLVSNITSELDKNLK